MRCDTVSTWLSAYLDGELDREQSLTLETHLAKCNSCSDELVSLRGSVAILRSLEMEEPPRELRPRILAAIRATHSSPWAWLLTWTRLPAPRLSLGLGLAGAAALVGVLLGPGWNALRTPAPSKDRVVVAPNTSLPPVARSRRETKRSTAKRQGSTAATAARRLFGPPLIASAAGAEGATTEPKSDAPSVDASAAARTRRSDDPSLRRATASKRPRVVLASMQGSTRPSGRAGARTPPGNLSSPRRHPLPTAGSGRLTSSDRRDASPMDPMPSVPEPANPPERAPDEPTTMMASMPMVDKEMGGMASPMDDPLSSLRQRLADERRELPKPALVQPHNARTAPIPSVRIEF